MFEWLDAGTIRIIFGVAGGLLAGTTGVGWLITKQVLNGAVKVMDKSEVENKSFIDEAKKEGIGQLTKFLEKKLS